MTKKLTLAEKIDLGVRRGAARALTEHKEAEKSQLSILKMVARKHWP